MTFAARRERVGDGAHTASSCTIGRRLRNVAALGRAA